MITSEQIKELKQRAETLDRCLDIAAKRSEVEEKQKKTMDTETMLLTVKVLLNEIKMLLEN